MNAEQCRAYMHGLHRAQVINGKIKAGTITYKATRNPLRAEATPRVDYKGFDYNPPPAPPQVERWVYPETDWGLMLKFSSQKAIYQELEETAKRCEQRIREFKNKKSSDEQTARESSRTTRSERDEDNAYAPSARQSSRNFLAESGQLALNAASESLNYENPAESGRRNINNSMSKNVKALKELGMTSHPEIIEKFRAERAAEFIRKQKHAFDAPTGRGAPDEKFRPGGGSVNMEKIREKNNKRQAEIKAKKAVGPAPMQQPMPVDTGRMKEQLSSLLDQLNQTEDELSRQELKMALNHKTYNYEKEKRK